MTEIENESEIKKEADTEIVTERVSELELESGPMAEALTVADTLR